MNFSNPPFTEEETRRAIAAYFALTTYMDTLVGEVLSTVEEECFAGDTSIVYTSDHGDNNGRNGIFGKSTMYEDSVGVPLILAGPGLPEGNVVHTPVSLVDIYPTVLDLVGGGLAEEESDRPGRSLIRTIYDPDPDRVVLAEYHATCSTAGISMVRKRNFKYVHYLNHPPQFFDLEQDPDGLNDLSSDPSYTDTLEHMRKELFKILDPVEVDRRAKADQSARVALHGGREAVLAEGAIGYTPTPGVTPERG
jgi:choline-sulfatase